MDDAPIPLGVRRKKAEKRAQTNVEGLIASHLDSVTVEAEDVCMSRLNWRKRGPLM